MIVPKSVMETYYFKDPKKDHVIRELNGAFAHYYYVESKITLRTNQNEVLNGCLVLGNADLSFKGEKYLLNQFDFFYLPQNHEIEIIPNNNSNCKICYIKNQIEKEYESTFGIEHYDTNKFIPRGELFSKESITTYRTVWTAFKNGYFMSGITNIPMEALHQGVLTSVNIEKDKDKNTKIYPHIHPDFPELYLFCIDDKATSITQYLINEKGESVCKDLKNGEGLYFPGNLGHMNFGKPIYKNFDYCMYIWIIPTFGIQKEINPITLRY